MVRGIQQDGCGARVHDAFAALESGLDAMLAAVEDAELDRLDHMSLVGFLQRWEQFRNRMPVVDHVALRAAETSGLAAAVAQPSVARVLVGALQLSAGEAQRRVRAGEALGPRRAMTGEPLACLRPVLAAAQRAGEVTPDQVQVIVRALDPLDRPGFDPDDVAAGEVLLTRHAATFEPKVLGQLADQVVAAIDPDGSVPDERLVSERRRFCLRATKDGGWVGEFRLTGLAGAKLSAVLRPLAKPRPADIPASDGANLTTLLVTSADERSYEQRMHDALEDACDRLLRSGTLPDSGGVPATVIVTIPEETLRERVGCGRTSDGAALSAEQVLELADQADLIPTVVSAAGAVLAQGRRRRLASPAQTWALIARDGGCSFPGCDRSPEWCERHHVVAWVDGGSTDLDNLTLLCRFHHHQFERRGWTAAIGRDGLPRWSPPRWIDQQQRPLLNVRIQQGRLRLEAAAAQSEQPELALGAEAVP